MVAKRSVVKKPNPDKKVIYCRICEKQKDSSHFFSAVDPLDHNGFMSFCKDCLGELYQKIFLNEHTIQRSLLKLCRMINLKYSDAAVESTLNHLTTQKKEPNDESVPGIYKSKLMATQRTEIGKREQEDFTFVEPMRRSNEEIVLDGDDELRDVRSFWGKSFDAQDLQFLEEKFAEWAKRHKIETQSERTLLKFICIKELEIEKTLIEGGSVSTLVKEFQELLKTSALSPNMVNAANSGKSLDTFGVWIKDIEEKTPAEWWENQGLFKDIDNIDEYGEKYIRSAVRAFITGSRDFSTDEVSEILDKNDDDSLININDVDDG